MPDPASLSIIGAVTGLIGGITGIAGLVVGYIGYRRSQQIKALDLRLELRKQVSDLRATGAASRRKEEARSRSSKGRRSKVKGMCQGRMMGRGRAMSTGWLELLDHLGGRG